MNQAIEYFERHAPRMDYVELDHRHLPVGSGPVESAVPRVINLRFKAPRIFGETDPVADLMHLRSASKSGRWHELMERRTFPAPAFARLPRDRIHCRRAPRAARGQPAPTAGSQAGLTAPDSPALRAPFMSRGVRLDHGGEHERLLAVLEAGNTVAVAHGILGNKTTVTAGNDVYARFVPAARVRAAGNVIVSEYLREARVQAGDAVTLVGRPGNDRRGAILGGLTAAGRRITARRLGAEGSSPTTLVGGVDLDLLQQAARLQKLTDHAQALVARALRTLGLEKLPPRQLRSTLLGRTEPRPVAGSHAAHGRGPSLRMRPLSCGSR